MGNTASEVTSNIKAQADSKNGPECYKYLSVAGDGILVDLMKKALLTNDYTELDECIQKNVRAFLLNNGEGEYIPIETIVNYRSGVKPDASKGDASASNLQKVAKSKSTKFVCFDISKRGAVGESLIHLCFLNGTDTHNELAKRLIKHFPKMINDIYLSDEYFGENPLHIAIVNENSTMVKFLLLNGADVHQRCCGKFFCPDDQKSGRVDSLTSECPILPVNTNYMGYAYFGEYPLSFAAILNQEDCVRLLIAKNADPNKQDSNGNTVLHMLVINDNLPMFKLMLEFNADLNIKNRQGLTPLSLAAKLARKEMFQYIMQITREIYYVYGDIECAAFKLNFTDTLSDEGCIDTNSALHLIAHGETEKHLDLFDDLIIYLLNRKWETYIRPMLVFEVIMYLIFVALNGADLIMNRVYYSTLGSKRCFQEEQNFTQLYSSCSCAFLNPQDDFRHVRIIFDIAVVLYSIMFLLVGFMEMYAQGIKLYLMTLVSNPTKFFFLLALFCKILIVPMRLGCVSQGEDILTALAIVLMCTYVLYLGRGFKAVTTLVYIIHKTIRYDINRFMIIFFIFIAGFSQAFYIVYGYGQEPVEYIFSSPLKSIMDVLCISVRDLDLTYGNMLVAPYAILGRILLVIFLFVGSLLLINLLIAMMTSTYDHTNEFENEWLRQWSRQVLSLERSLSKTAQLKKKKKYTHLFRNGERVLVVKRKLDCKKREETIGIGKVDLMQMFYNLENQ